MKGETTAAAAAGADCMGRTQPGPSTQATAIVQGTWISRATDHLGSGGLARVLMKVTGPAPRCFIGWSQCACEHVVRLDAIDAGECGKQHDSFPHFCALQDRAVTAARRRLQERLNYRHARDESSAWRYCCRGAHSRRAALRHTAPPCATDRRRQRRDRVRERRVRARPGCDSNPASASAASSARRSPAGGACRSARRPHDRRLARPTDRSPCLP